MFYRVVTSSRSPGIANGLTYESSDAKPLQGMPVRVSLRKKIVEGIVVEVLEKKEETAYAMKGIDEVLGESPVLTQAQIRTALWMSEYYCATLRQSVGLWFPPPPWSRVFPKARIGYKLSEGATDTVLRGEKQNSVRDHLLGKDWVSKEDLTKEFGNVTAVLSALSKRGIVTAQSRSDEQIHPKDLRSTILAKPALTEDQILAYESIRSVDKPSLLFGITGSGKTEVYAQLIADTIAEGKQALLLVPEILLTEYSIQRFEALLRRDAISVLHSRLSIKERCTEWKKIAQGDAALVIGSRSALFAPLKNLGLIVIDEEHEWTYKNEQSPRYHVRETAEALARFSHARLVLGTATPSLEAWARAKSGTYHLVRLRKRYLDQHLPIVRIIDLADTTFGKYYPFTPELLSALDERLARKEQSVLFLNRRGMATALLCLACRRRVICPESQLPFTVHTAGNGNPYLLDHTTGIRADVPSRCPHCKATDLLAVGAGTQKLESVLAARFPSAVILRADSDTLKDAEEMREILRKMRERKADILFGTQSVVKGLDLPGVTLAAVLLADNGLSLPHFRAGERVFDLLTQLVGRSGRSQSGKVIIQTFRPDAPEIIAAARHETEKYLDDELKLRIHGGYPPATKIVRLLVRGVNPALQAKRLLEEARAAAKGFPDVASIHSSPTFSNAGKEWQILLRGSEPRLLLSKLDLRDVTIDVDPIETL